MVKVVGGTAVSTVGVLELSEVVESSNLLECKLLNADISISVAENEDNITHAIMVFQILQILVLVLL